MESDRIREAAVWLSLKQTGWTVRQIAMFWVDEDGDGLSERTIRHWLQKAREAQEKRPKHFLPRFLILTGVGLLSPHAPCPHRGPIPQGAKVYCTVCHATGCDHWQIFQSRRDWPAADKKTKAKELKPETRAEQRAKLPANADPRLK